MAPKKIGTRLHKNKSTQRIRILWFSPSSESCLFLREIFSSGDTSLFLGSSFFGGSLFGSSFFGSFLSVPVSGLPFAFAAGWQIKSQSVKKLAKIAWSKSTTSCCIKKAKGPPITSLLRAPPPSDGTELMAEPGRLPDSDPRVFKQVEK